ncbi:MAG: hypothetical protein U0670_16245, partial [Anaerolineae bacterium]
MIELTTTATPTGLILGCIFGLAPLIIAFRAKHYRAGILGFIACALSGFGCGLLGGLLMIFIATSVVFSYVYVNRQDPFVMLQSTNGEVFQETRREIVIRMLARIGDNVRASGAALIRNKA